VLVKQWIAPCVRQGFSLDDKEGTEPGARRDTPGTRLVRPSNNYQFHADVERQTGGTGEKEREREREGGGGRGRGREGRRESRHPPPLPSSSWGPSSDNYSRASSE